MSWTMIERKKESKREDISEFMEALMMIKEGTEILCELAEEMDELYGERNSRSYGMRSSMGNRKYRQKSDEEDYDQDERRGYSMRYK